jgi:uncharacterized HAD superfamily protein
LAEGLTLADTMIINKFKIGIDIDNVLTDSYQTVLDEFNRRFDTKVLYHQVFDFYYLEKHAGVDEKTARQFIRDRIHAADFHEKLLPDKNALKKIKNWQNENFIIHYISARHDTSRGVTKKWLDKHGFLTHVSKLHLQNYGIFEDVALFKNSVIESLGISILIEDSLEVALKVEIPVFLFDKPWNQGKLPKNVKRIHSWEEIEIQ